jgi:hypothetical protein
LGMVTCPLLVIEQVLEASTIDQEGCITR